MSAIPLMQQALGAQWQQLPPALQAHYQQGRNTDVGALVNRRGNAVRYHRGTFKTRV